MSDKESIINSIVGDLKEIRRHRGGCVGYVEEHKKGLDCHLWKILGCIGKSTNYKVACLIKLIQCAMSEPKEVDLLLMAFGLLHGYTDDQVGNRRRKYAETYTSAWRNTKVKWKDVQGSLTDLEDTQIDILAAYIVGHEDISQILPSVARKYRTITLPKPKHRIEENGTPSSASISLSKFARRHRIHIIAGFCILVLLTGIMLGLRNTPIIDRSTTIINISPADALAGYVNYADIEYNDGSLESSLSGAWVSRYMMNLDLGNDSASIGEQIYVLYRNGTGFFQMMNGGQLVPIESGTISAFAGQYRGTYLISNWL